MPGEGNLLRPQYDQSGGASHDLGLIHLATPVKGITPSPVNLLKSTTPIGSVVRQVGFGTRQLGAQGPAGAEYVIANRTAIACSQDMIGPLSDPISCASPRPTARESAKATRAARRS